MKYFGTDGFRGEANKNLNVLSLLVQSSFVIVSIIWGISILAMIVSVIVSVKIYRKKDLA